NPPSRFLGEIPDRLLDWWRLGSAQTSWANTSATARYRERNRQGFSRRIDTAPARPAVPELAAGDRVLHTKFGLGTVVQLLSRRQQMIAEVDFGSAGVKKLDLQVARLEKLT
ncbi:MAG: ATP-dependent DNA helicase PcrA, partial [Propionibacteriaceae bacterium]|nr:ATP-dependent DNA helicase PcrA [Propionibacteriaceae bacterium]